MKNLNKEEINQIVHSLNSIVTIKNKKYYVKTEQTNFNYSEIIGERLAKLLNIHCAHYECIKYNNCIYYLSEIIGDSNTFVTGESLNLLGSSIYEIWHRLEQQYSKDTKDLMFAIVKIFLYDIIFMNSDRGVENYGILKEDNKYKIYIFDNEFIFDYSKVFQTSKFWKSEHLRSPHQLPEKTERFLKQNLEELEFFLATSSEEFISLFTEMLALATPDVVRNIFLEVEKEVDDTIANKEEFIRLYEQNYGLMQEILETRGKNGKRIH